MSTTKSSPSTSPPTETRRLGEAKPIKLRSACNCCFTAKVRCDGNKEGCKRCAEKRLHCTYSESMVGKVVGKRRKRPLPESKSTTEIKQNQWNKTVRPTALPSPAPTVTSEQPNKRQCMLSEWANLIQYDDQSLLDSSDCEDQFVNWEMSEGVDSSPSNNGADFTVHAGLPTPSMSPPETKYLSLTEVEVVPQPYAHVYSEVQPQTRPSSVAPVPVVGECQKSASLHGTDASLQGQVQLQAQIPTIEDDETACIKLLAHLKRFSAFEQQSFQATLALVNKTNAALRWLLRRHTIRTDYTCHLLLTNVVIHLASFCEQLLQYQESRTNKGSNPEQEFVNNGYLEDESEAFTELRRQKDQSTADSRAVAKVNVQESRDLCSKIADLLKRKPLNGFQILGRNESALIELDVRIGRVLSAIS